MECGCHINELVKEGPLIVLVKGFGFGRERSCNEGLITREIY